MREKKDEARVTFSTARIVEVELRRGIPLIPTVVNTPPRLVSFLAFLRFPLFSFAFLLSSSSSSLLLSPQRVLNGVVVWT